MATTKFLGASTVKFLGATTLKFIDTPPGVKTWVTIDTTSSANSYSSDFDTIAAGSFGCATTTEGLDVLPSASGYAVGAIARVTVFDSSLNPCGTYHWYEVQLI